MNVFLKEQRSNLKIKLLQIQVIQKKKALNHQKL